MYTFDLINAVPGQITVSLGTIRVTTITLSWTSTGSVVDNYVVMWQRDTSGECPGDDEDSVAVRGGSTSCRIVGLEEDSSYSITVTAHNAAGSSAVSNTVTVIIPEAGGRQL